MSDNNANQVGGYLTAFALGAAIGAGLALLYAPRSGEETRKILAKRAEDLKDRAEHTLEDAKDYIRHKKDEIAAAVEAGKEAMREEREKHTRKNA